MFGKEKTTPDNPDATLDLAMPTKEHVVSLAVANLQRRALEKDAAVQNVLGTSQQDADELWNEFEKQKREAEKIIDLFGDMTWSQSVETFYDDATQNAKERADGGEHLYNDILIELHKLRSMPPLERAKEFFTRELDSPVASAAQVIDLVALGLGDGKRDKRTVYVSPPIIDTNLMLPDNYRNITAAHLTYTLLGLPIDSLQSPRIISLPPGREIQELHFLKPTRLPITIGFNGPPNSVAGREQKAIPHLKLTVH